MAAAVMTAQALVSAIDGMTNESSGDELFSELETQEYKEAFELFDKVGGAISESQPGNIKITNYHAQLKGGPQVW